MDRAAARYLRVFDVPSGRPRDNWGGRLWISPAELRLTRPVSPPVAVGRSLVETVTFGRHLTADRLDLELTPEAPRVRPVAFIVARAVRPRVDAALLAAGWPVNVALATPDITRPTDAVWFCCRERWSRGWVIIEGGRLGVETRRTVTWHEIESSTVTVFRATERLTTLEIVGAGLTRRIVVPRGRELRAALAERGWTVVARPGIP